MSVQSGALIVACISAILALVWVKIPNSIFRWMIGVFSPLLVAYCFYWYPVWFFHGSVAEYSAWELFFVGIWSVSGLSVSVFIIMIHCCPKQDRIKN